MGDEGAVADGARHVTLRRKAVAVTPRDQLPERHLTFRGGLRSPTRRRVRGVLSLLVTGSLLLGPALTAQGDALDDKRRAAQQRAAQAREQYEAAVESVEGLSADLAAAVLALEETKARLPAVEAALQTAEQSAEKAQREAGLAASEVQNASDERDGLQATIERDDVRDAELRSAAAALAREAYKRGSGGPPFAVALDAQSLGEFTDSTQGQATAQRVLQRRTDELAAIDSRNRNNQARITAVVASLSELEAVAQTKAAQAEQALAVAQGQRDALARTLADQAAATQRLETKKQQAQAEQEATDAVRAGADAEVARIAAEQEAAARLAATSGAPRPGTGSNGEVVSPSASTTSGAPVFSNPTSIEPMYVTSNYGMRLHPILGYVRLHAGIDLRTYCNTPLYAPRDGTVQWSEWRNGFGNQVMISYGVVDGQSLLSSSNHLTRSVVQTGESVRRGQLIGYSGNTGLSGACHLHFEAYVGGKTVDPAPLLGLR